MSSDEESEEMINNRFKVQEVIGKGSYGWVFLGLDTENDDRPVALKLEAIVEGKKCFLENEYKFYNALAGGPGIPEVRKRPHAFHTRP